jgi:flagellar protein FliS
MRTDALRDRYRADAVETMSPGRLIVALYDRMLTDLDRAEAAIAARDVCGAHAALVHAQEIVAELHDCLDVTAWPQGRALADVYVFVLRELVAANLHKDPARVQACRQLVSPLREAWRDAAGVSGA